MPRLGLALVLTAPLLVTACRASCVRVRCTRATTAPRTTHAAAAVGPALATKADESSTDAAIYEALRFKRVMNLQWATTTIPDAVAYLRTITGLNFYVTAKAQLEKEDARVPLTVDNVSVADILDIMASQNGMAWEVRDGLVRIATAEEVRGTYLLRYYDINDLFLVVPTFSSNPPLNFPSEHVPPNRAPPDDALARLLAVTIRSLIDPESWAHGHTTVETRKGVLIARTTPATHVKIQRYLDSLRAGMGR